MKIKSKMSEPYSIRIFVPSGDPEGVRIIERFNRKGKAVVFQRSDWEYAKDREEMNLSGVYILSGYGEDDEDKPLIYIGQTDNLKVRLKDHIKKKQFWTTACIFVMTENMDKGRTAWLEYALVKQANDIERCILDNIQIPPEPNLSEADRAETNVFLREMLQVLPLIGIHAFEKARVITPSKGGVVIENSAEGGGDAKKDLIIVPAREEGFQDVFMSENAWYAVRIAGGMLPQLKWIAAYQVRPVSAITHIAKIDHIEPYGDAGKYKIVFDEVAIEQEAPITLGQNPNLAPQAPRYTSYDALMKAKTMQDLFS